MNSQRLWLVMLAGLGLLMIAAPLTAQVNRGRGPGPGPRGPLMEMRIVEQALRRQEAIGLSSEQVARLEAVRARVQEQNAPLIEQVREAMPAREELRDSVRARVQEDRQNGRGVRPARVAAGMRQEVRAELAPVLEQIRTNAETAAREARQILTAEQFLQLRGDRLGSMGGARMRPMGGGRGSPQGDGRPFQGRQRR